MSHQEALDYIYGGTDCSFPRFVERVSIARSKVDFQCLDGMRLRKLDEISDSFIDRRLGYKMSLQQWLYIHI